ncbi:MAG: U32 family peptidase [Syntrophorhabdaceae bacterium]|nr:U32 family peptidase [Syntrophorhabdaceae bacterium]
MSREDDPKRSSGKTEGKPAVVRRGPGEVKPPPPPQDKRQKFRRRKPTPVKEVRPDAALPDPPHKKWKKPPPLHGGPPPKVARPEFPELLAPAGFPEAYFAAVDAGADAVYLGLEKFNARARAENFGISDLCRILPHAKARGVRVYLAINALLTEADLPEVIDLVHNVAPLSPDAVIAADLGLLRILHEFFPHIPVHVSTQAGCASGESAEEFARLGASRVILERHLQMSEVARIAARSTIGVEIFVHGSLCYSYSGKCFFSSFLGGKSGNRGECVQPCRRVYEYGQGKSGAIFSTGDLSLLPRLPEIAGMGIAALKIEGRMRGAEYVHGVVSAYRFALDAIRDGKPEEGVEEGMRLLSSVIGRAATPGITGGAAAPEVAAGGESGNVGEPLGVVASIKDGWAFIPGAGTISPGDRLRIQFVADGSGRGFSAAAQDTRSEETGLSLKIPFSLSAGDLLFRTAGGGRSEYTRRARREMEAAQSAGARFCVVISKDEVEVKASYGSVAREYRYRVSGPKEGRPGVVPEDGARRLLASYKGDLPIAEVQLECRGAPSAWSDVKSLFLQAARSFDKEFHLDGKRLRLEILPSLRVTGARPEGPVTSFFVSLNADQLAFIPKTPEIIPVVEMTKALLRDPSPLILHARAGAYFKLPTPLLESDASFLRRTVTEAVGKGLTRWVLPDVGYFRFFAPSPIRRQTVLVSDHYLYAFNTAAFATLSRLGAARVILPVETTMEALRSVGKFLYGIGIAVAYGRVPLMISRLLPAAGVRDAEAVSPRGERFSLRGNEHGSTVFPPMPFSASGSLGEMRSAGVRDFYADLKGAPAEEVAAVLESLLADRVIPGASTFNLFRGNF